MYMAPFCSYITKQKDLHPNIVVSWLSLITRSPPTTNQPPGSGKDWTGFRQVHQPGSFPGHSI